MKFSIKIDDVQHINSMIFSSDLSLNKLTCIVGKNGVGKTTLFRAIKNLQSANIFQKTASPYIFNKDSKISYQFDDKKYCFYFNEKIGTIDTKDIISDDIKKSIIVELAMPDGERFNHFQKLSDIDEELRKYISIRNYKVPDELINFLSSVYGPGKFENLKEVQIKDNKYYFILLNDDYYIREDYLSSGEYFLINLYKSIQLRCKFIVIDEIDISLDASAQVNLIKLLREYCKDYQINILFTTHSLALMRTLKNDELYYMEQVDDCVLVELKSYNYIKSILFGFSGWDKYILTEDRQLKSYLTHLLSHNDKDVFYKFKIIYIGGASNVIDLMKRNSNEHFFSESENVICVLDGDQSDKLDDNIICIPFESIEKDLLKYYNETNSKIPRVEIDIDFSHKNAGKPIFKALIDEGLMSERRIYSFLNRENQEIVNEFKEILYKFLN